MSAEMGEGGSHRVPAMNSVLIVDDEAVVRRMLSRVLERENYTVHEAESVASALKVLASAPISVMLCDRKMPGKNGDWLISQMNKRFPATAVILITADDAVPPRIALQPGVVGYFVKPFRTAAICDAVRDAMAWHQVASRSRRSNEPK